jgi:HD-like signal output (HDOD) protein
VRFPGVLSEPATYQRIVADLHGRIAHAILRHWDIADEILVAVLDCENPDREHEGVTDLTDVLAVGGALASLGTDPMPEQMLFLGMPAARRMALDAQACGTALRESHQEIVSLRQALGS